MSGVEGHTGLPWTALPDDEGAFQIVVPGKVICSRRAWPHNQEQSHANAAFIVQAVNNHDDLVAALRRLKEILTVPAAEYVPAITDAWDVIDFALSRVSGSIGGGG